MYAERNNKDEHATSKSQSLGGRPALLALCRCLDSLSSAVDGGWADADHAGQAGADHAGQAGADHAGQAGADRAGQCRRMRT